MFDILYFIILFDENYRQYLVRYIIFICIRWGAPQIKKARASSAPCASRPQKVFAPRCALRLK